MRPEIRAAWRLERIGLTHVFDDEDGEADWVAYGLPTVGSRVRGGWFIATPRPAGSPNPSAPSVTGLPGVDGSGREQCVVVDAACIVHCRLDSDELSIDPESTSEAVMQAGPATIRPGEALTEMVVRMAAHDVATLIVKTSDDRLVGVLRRSETEQVPKLDQHRTETSDQQ